MVHRVNAHRNHKFEITLVVEALARAGFKQQPEESVRGLVGMALQKGKQTLHGTTLFRTFKASSDHSGRLSCICDIGEPDNQLTWRLRVGWSDRDSGEEKEEEGGEEEEPEGEAGGRRWQGRAFIYVGEFDMFLQLHSVRCRVWPWLLAVGQAKEAASATHLPHLPAEKEEATCKEDKVGIERDGPEVFCAVDSDRARQIDERRTTRRR